MDWYEIELDGNRTSAFPQYAIPGVKAPSPTGRASDSESDSPAYIGGIVNDGKCVWLACQNANDPTLLICNVETGERVSRHDFGDYFSADVCCEICYVKEVCSDTQNLLAVCVEVSNRPEGSSIKGIPPKTYVAIYSIAWSQVLRFIDVGNLFITTLSSLNPLSFHRTVLRHFDGCLLIGTEEGVVLLLDLNIEQLIAKRKQNVRPAYHNFHSVGIKRVHSASSISRMTTALLNCRERDEEAHFAIEVNASTYPSSISCIVPIDFINGFAAGTDNGSIYIFDLLCFKCTCEISTPTNENYLGDVQRFCYIVPPDDPKPCFYICAMYNKSKQGRGLQAVLHCISYEVSHVDDINNSFYFENFQTKSTSMRWKLDDGNCEIIECKTASTLSFAGDNGTLVVVLSWYSQTEHKNKVMFLDINQWYKQEMPSFVRPYETNAFMSGYILSGQNLGLALLLKPTSILHFNSIQRREEYAYPNALGFDCLLLTYSSLRYYAHDGLQQRFLNALRCQKADLFLQPKLCVDEIERLCLTPYLYTPEQPLNSKNDMYELILSVALEHYCMSLLYDCARSWLDGSYQCNLLENTELALTTLTNWIKKRADQMEARCVELCQGIFDYGGYPLVEREKMELMHLMSQIQQLLVLLRYILNTGKRSLNPLMYDDLSVIDQEISVTYEMRRVLYWFIDCGLLPEGQNTNASVPAQSPLKLIKQKFEERRKQMIKLSNQSNRPIVLYIDALISHSGMGKEVRHDWKSFSGSTLYPPNRIEELLQVVSIFSGQLEHKHAIILYFLFDLNELQEQKALTNAPRLKFNELFKSTFNISEHLWKSVRSFWFLDRGYCSQALNELYDVCTRIHNYEEWQIKLLVDVLLACNAFKSAMRVIDMPPGPVPSLLKLRVLLANDSIPDAFHHARLYEDENGKSLLEYFFRHCIDTCQFKVLSELNLHHEEEALVYRLLRQCNSKKAECVQLILLLQKSKYIEAVSFMDEVAAEREHQVSNGAIGDTFSDASNVILAAYRTTMAPVTQTIAGKYFRMKDKLKPEQLANNSPVPFSCQLAKYNANFMPGGIFQSSFLSTHWTTTNCVGDDDHRRGLNTRNVPFLRNPQFGFNRDHVLPSGRRTVRPTPFVAAQKRIREAPTEKGIESPPAQLQPLKRRRLIGEQVVDEVCSYVKSKFESSPPQLSIASHTSLLSALAHNETAKSMTQQLPESTPRKSILKRTVEPSTFKFMPPIPLHSLNSQNVMANEETDETEESQESDEIIMSIELSDDSEFFSPLSSANTSLVPRALAGPKPRVSLQHTETIDSTRAIGTPLSSGFGSLEQHPTAGPFVPTVCSSKVCDTQSVFQINTVKFSERTTVYGGSGMDTDIEMPEPSTGTIAACSSSSIRPHTHQLLADTTLGMSAYEMTALETLPIQKTEVEKEIVAVNPQNESASDVDYINLETGNESETMLLNVEVSDEKIDDFQTRNERQSSATTHAMEQEIKQHSESLEMEKEAQKEDTSVSVQQLQSRSSSNSVSSCNEEDEVVEVEVVETDNMMYMATGQQMVSTSIFNAEDEPSVCSYNSFNSNSSGTSLNSPLEGIAPAVVTAQSHRELSPAEPLFSIVVESSSSISRSASNSPNSMTATESNDSANSTPPRGNTANRSRQALYRPNSLETVEDLDTTKGSMDEEEEQDGDDECVIALDGTKVRDYVPRARPALALTTNEEDARCNERNAAKLELTVGSIESKNMEENKDEVPIDIENEEVPMIDMDTKEEISADVEDRNVDFESKEPMAADEKANEKDKGVETEEKINEEDEVIESEEQSLNLTWETNRNTRSASAPPSSEGTHRYNLRASSLTPRSPNPSCTPTTPRERKKSTSDVTVAPNSDKRQRRAMSTPPTSTPKRSKPAVSKRVLEVIEEDTGSTSRLAQQGSSSRVTRSRARLEHELKPEEDEESATTPSNGTRKTRVRKASTEDSNDPQETQQPLAISRRLRSSSQEPLQSPSSDRTPRRTRLRSASKEK